MDIRVERAEYRDIEARRELYRQEANCQIIHDSILRRGMADPYLIEVNGRFGGYGGVWNSHNVGDVMEFYTLPHLRGNPTGAMFREFLAASAATGMEAQTNMPSMLTLLWDFCAASRITEEAILFHDGFVSALPGPPGAVFRHARPEDHGPDADAEWVVEAADGAVVASGGFLCHYNPPYGDVYMAVSESARGQGFGSYLVQEIKRVCYEAGKKPAARCNPSNVASRRTLQKAGFLPCGRLLRGEIGQP